MSIPRHTIPPRHVLSELGFDVVRAGDELHGVVDVFGPRVPVTLELDMQLYEPPHEHDRIHAVGRLLKAGRNVIVLTVEFVGDDGRPIGVGTGSFMASPNPNVSVLGSLDEMLDARLHMSKRLEVPLAERSGCVRVAPGIAEQPKTDET